MQYAGAHGSRTRQEVLVKQLAGKVAVITGAGSGFGRELARIAAGEGMKLMLADIQKDALDEAVEEARASGAEAACLRVDVASAADVQRLSDHTNERFGAAQPLLNKSGGPGCACLR